MTQKSKLAGYVVLAEENGRFGVCILMDKRLMMTFSGQDGTIFKTRPEAQRYCEEADQSKVGTKWEKRQHFVSRIRWR